MTTATMNPNLRDFWTTPSRYKVLYGGRGSGKTWDAAANLVRIMQFCKVKVLCTRKFQSRIDDSVKSEIEAQIERFGLQNKFDCQAKKTICKATGSEVVYYGIERNIKEIKGMAGIDILWLEEAEDVSEDDFNIIEPTIRKEGSEIWIVLNPKRSTDFIYRTFCVDPPPNAKVKKINYTENPFFSGASVETMERIRRNSEEDYRHYYLGEPLNDDDQAIIKRTWVQSAVNAHIKLGVDIAGSRRIGFDVADDGGDLNAMCVTHGQLLKHVEEWKGLEDELLKSATRVWTRARDDGASIDYDSIGVGASAGAKFKELNQQHKEQIYYRSFNAGGKVLWPDREYLRGTRIKNKDQFANLKAQSWWNVADRLRKTHMWVTQGVECDPAEIISIDPNVDKLEKLITELSTPHKDYDPSGRSKVESKKDLAKRDVASPNIADAFIMAYCPVKETRSWAAAV